MSGFRSLSVAVVSLFLVAATAGVGVVGADGGTGVTSPASTVGPADRPATTQTSHSIADGDTTAQSEDGNPNATTASIARSAVEAWNRTYGGDGTTVVTDLVATDDGGYLVAGVTGFDSPDADAWLLKLRGDGSRVWSRTYDETAIDVVRDVIETDDGYLLAGATDVSFSTSEAWLVKVTDAGRTEWSRRYGDAPFTAATGVVRTADGYAFAGVTGDVDSGNTSAWLVTTSDRGRVRWSETYAADSVAGIVRGHDAAYVLAGTANDRGDGWAAGVSARGTLLWNREYGTGNDRVNAVRRTTDGYLLGGVAGLDGADDGDAWLVGTDRDGRRQWTETYGEAGLDSIVSMVTVDDGYLFSGVRGEGETNGISWGVAVGDRGGVRWSESFGRSGFSVDDLVIQPTAAVAGHDGGYLFASVAADGSVRVVRLVPGDEVFDRPLPGIEDGSVPTDPDGDGLFEDVNGDGQVTFGDAVDLAFADTDGLSDVQVAALDLDGDGDLDFDDAVELAFQTNTDGAEVRALRDAAESSASPSE